MANEEGPAGLSTSAIPTGLRARGIDTARHERKLAADEVDDLPDRPLGGEARRLAMTAAARLAGDRRHVDLVVTRPQRDPARRPLVALRLADERDHLGAIRRPQRVDEALRVRLLGTDVAEVVLEQVRHDEPPAFEELRPLERTREQLQLRELDGLVDVPEDPVHVGAGLDELGGEAE